MRSRIKYAQFSLVGASNALLIGAGWFLGNNWTQVADIVGQVSNVVIAVVVIGALALAITWYVRRKRK